MKSEQPFSPLLLSQTHVRDHDHLSDERIAGYKISCLDQQAVTELNFPEFLANRANKLEFKNRLKMAYRNRLSK